MDETPGRQALSGCQVHRQPSSTSALARCLFLSPILRYHIYALRNAEFFSSSQKSRIQIQIKESHNEISRTNQNRKGEI